MRRKDKILTTVLLLLVLLAFIVYLVFSDLRGMINAPTNFEECAAAGYPVMESYPRQCSAYGDIFVEVIDNGGGKVYCNPSDRGGDYCTKEYVPVCGWFGQNIQCIKYPCASTYGNKCEACQNEDVGYYTQGICPS